MDGLETMPYSPEGSNYTAAMANESAILPSALPLAGSIVPAGIQMGHWVLPTNVYLLAYLSGAISFWVTTGTFYYLQVVSDRFRPAWEPRGQHGVESWRIAFRKAAWNLHVSLPSFILFCAAISFKVFAWAGVQDPSQNVRWVGESWTQMLVTMGIMAFVDDLVFWTAHWGLHSHPYLFKNIHALHHRYHNPIAPAVFYTHPIDFIASYVRAASCAGSATRELIDVCGASLPSGYRVLGRATPCVLGCLGRLHRLLLQFCGGARCLQVTIRNRWYNGGVVLCRSQVR